MEITLIAVCGVCGVGNIATQWDPFRTRKGVFGVEISRRRRTLFAKEHMFWLSEHKSLEGIGAVENWLRGKELWSSVCMRRLERQVTETLMSWAQSRITRMGGAMGLAGCMTCKRINLSSSLEKGGIRSSWLAVVDWERRRKCLGWVCLLAWKIEKTMISWINTGDISGRDSLGRRIMTLS